MFHQLTSLCKVVEIPCNFYYASDVMVSILLVRGLFDSSEQIIKVLVSNRKLFQKSVLLEQLEAKMVKRLVL